MGGDVKCPYRESNKILSLYNPGESGNPVVGLTYAIEAEVVTRNCLASDLRT